MSIRQIGFVQELPLGSCSPAERNLLHAIAWFADHQGDNIWPGHEALCRRAAITKRWLQVLLRRLTDRGWLVILERGRGRGHRSAYELRLPTVVEHQPQLPIGPVEKLLKSCGKVPRARAADGAGKGDRSITKGDRSCTQEVAQTSLQSTASVAKFPPIRPLIRPGTTKDPEQRLRRDSLQGRQPSADGNYRVALKLAHQVLDAHPGIHPSDSNVTAALKGALAQLRIRYDGDLVGRVLASAWAARLVSTFEPAPPVTGRRRRARA